MPPRKRKLASILGKRETTAVEKRAEAVPTEARPPSRQRRDPPLHQANDRAAKGKEPALSNPDSSDLSQEEDYHEVQAAHNPPGGSRSTAAGLLPVAGARQGNGARQARRSLASGVVSTFFVPHKGGSARSVAELHLNADDETSLRAVVAALPERFPIQKAALRARYREQFGKWWSQWRSGHSLLFYGLGSKQSLLDEFARECSGDGACLAIDGLHPGITARQVLANVAALARQTRAGHYRQAAPQDLLRMISDEMATRRVYVVLHNIDGPGLRDASAQRLLSELAALPNVHLAASIDHVNAPLLWDLQTRDRFAWAWHGLHTFQPYIQEVAKAAMPSMFAGKREGVSRASALVVLSSMNATAREVFRLVADAQLDSEGDGGLPFQRLFQQCRDRFVVSNQMALTAFLTEFKDHNIVTTKRGSDGAELLCVPLEAEALRHVLSEMEAGR